MAKAEGNKPTMMRTKTGRVKEAYKHILPRVTEVISALVSELYKQKLSPEEIIGIIAGQATISVRTEKVKERIKNEN